jgi:predicted outer membrane repeat protein
MTKQTNLTTKAHLVRGAFYLLLLLAVCVIPFTLAQRITAKGNRPANVITVTNGNDSGPGSLRQALADAQDGDTINFDPSVNIVTLTTAELAITKSITISASPQMVTVQRSSQTEFRIFHVMPGYSVEINGLTISGGHITGDNGGGILNDNSTLTFADCTVSGNTIVSASSANNSGGGIYNSGTMSLNQVIVNNNNAVFGGQPSAVSFGGGISNAGTMIIIAGTVQSNMGFYSGGGILNSGMMTITGSTISNNQTGNPGHSGGSGGGIVNYGTLTIQDSTISGNRATGGDFEGYGGGIYGNNNTITNSTITGNSAVRGGGVAGGGNIAHTTFSNNSASLAGGALYLTSTLELGNTILKAGASGVNIFNNGGSFITHGYNISSDDGGGFLNGPGDQINTDPMLGPLQDNGGPTFTHALLPGSPAIDAGDPKFTPPPYYDQRGPVFWRVRNGRIDVGSFEVQAGTTPSPTPTPTASPTPTTTPTATATPTCAPTYTTGTQTGTITPGTTNIGSACDDCITPITLPFAVGLYDNSYTSAQADSNGVLAFTSASSTFQSSCLPSLDYTDAIFPFWDDLRTDNSQAVCASYPGGTCGIFTAVTGSAPNRIFVVEWRAAFAQHGDLAHFEILLHENSSDFEVVYGTFSQGSTTNATAGVQRGTGLLFTQFACHLFIPSDTQVNYTFKSTICTPTPTATATVTHTPTVTPTSTPTSTATPTLTPRPSPTQRPELTPRPRPTPPPRP